jgi:hypothetical protein
VRLALAITVALLFTLTGLASPVALAHSAPRPSAPTLGSPRGVPPPSPDPALPVLPRDVRMGLLNRTLPIHLASGGLPTSSYPETPAPVLPNTTPMVISFPQDVTSCCVTQIFTAPPGPFAAIEFTYTGSIVMPVYDSSYRAYVDGVQIMEGTSPEYGTWTVQKDLTEYASLFQGSVNLTLLIGVATLGGHFVTNLSLAFYPVGPGFPAPPAPTEIVPLWAWNHTYLSTAGGTLWTNATVPDNVTNATLQLFLYGFGPTDEFWYSAQPGYRQAFVTVDGHVFGTAYPYPYLNTGGIDLFLWRPITGTFTIDDRPQSIDVSGALGLLEGTHEFGVNLSGGLGSGNTWLIGGSLLLYTAANAGPATSTAYAYSHPSPSHTSGSSFDDSSSTTTLAMSSSVTIGHVLTNLTTNLSGSFRNDQTLGGSSTSNPQTSTQNVSMDEQLETVTTASAPNGSAVTVRSTDFPFVIDLDNLDTLVSKSGNSETINFTTEITNFHQEWSEMDATGPGTVLPPDGPTARVDDLATAAGQYSGQETVNTVSGGATLNALFGSTSSISKSYTASVVNGDPSWSYAHLLSASGSDPPGPFNAQTLLGDSVEFPIAGAISASASFLDLGQSVNLSAIGIGGTGTYQYGWSSLPAPCVSADRPSILCRPGSPGTYRVALTLTDTGANNTTVSSEYLTVAPALTVGIVPARSAWDAGQNLSLTASVNGGSGVGDRCTWLINGSAMGLSSTCFTPFNLSGAQGTTTTVEILVTDSTGFTANSTIASFSPSEPPLVTVDQIAPATSPLRESGGLEFNGTILGGSPPYTLVWSIDGANVSGATSTWLDWYAPSPQNVTAILWVTDASGWIVGSTPVTAYGGVNSFAGHSGTTSTTGSGTDETGWYVALIVAAITLPVILYLALARPPTSRRPPPPRRPAPPRPPS